MLRKASSTGAYRLLETNPAADDAQRDANNEPNGYNDKHGRERHRAARLLSPEKEVKKEEGGEDGSRNQNRSKSDILLPSVSTECFVNPR